MAVRGISRLLMPTNVNGMQNRTLQISSQQNRVNVAGLTRLLRQYLLLVFKHRVLHLALYFSGQPALPVKALNALSIVWRATDKSVQRVVVIAAK
jgi:hypothetical protein